MSSLIDLTFFVKKLNIPNTGDPAIIETVQSYILQYEPIFLERLFGYPLYAAYMASPADQRFVDIIDGKEFTDINGNLNKWKGLIEILVPAPTPPATTPTQQRQSPIANFVYFKYRVENVSQFTGIGELLPSAENATMVSPRRKLSMVWNEMREQVIQLMAFLTANQSAYPEWNDTYRIQALKSFGYVNPFF